MSENLSPYIAEAIRKRKRDRKQLAALHIAGITPPPGMTLAEYVDQERREQKRRQHRARLDRRRARLVGAAVERFTREDIIARDGLTCYLCGHPVQPDDVHLDHVVPLTRGGNHTKENVRVSHSACNMAKGVLTPEQFRATFSSALART